jgi:hypothetical protein
MIKTLKWLNLLLWFVLMVSCLVRNGPWTPLRDSFAVFEKNFHSPFAFYHRGWGMFPSLTQGAALNRIKFVYRNGAEEILDAFPLHSSFKPSVWNEVLEDIVAGHDDAANNDVRRVGYLKYQCKHRYHPLDQSSGLPVKIVFEQRFMHLYQLFTNYGQPYQPLTYNVVREHVC